MDLPTSKLATPDFLQHSKPDDVYSQLKNSFFFPLLEFLIQNGSEGFSTNLRIHQNLFHSRMFSFFEDTMQNINPETVLKCRLNGTEINDENILHFLCPDDRYRVHRVPDIREIVKKLKKTKDPQFVTRGIFHFFWMNPNNTRSPPPEVGRLRGRALAKLNRAERTMLLNLNLETASSVLAPCGTHTTQISCTDDSKDFCEGSTSYVGLLILFAIFLPGIVRALGNLMFYKVSICSMKSN